MTTIQALQTLYVALGGTATDVENLNTIPEMVSAFASLDAIGASGIVTKDNDGEVNIQSSIGLNLTADDTLRLTGSSFEICSTGSAIRISDDDFSNKTLKECIQQVIDEQSTT